MATTTTLKCIGGSYGHGGNGSYTNGAGSSIYVGYDGEHFRSRLIFPSLRASLGLGNSTIKISSVVLYMRRTGEGPATVKAGCSTSSAWGAVQLGAGQADIAATTKWYAINISGVGAYIDDYTGNWYLHLTAPSTGNDRIRFNGYATDFTPYIKVTWEYVANTIKTDIDEAVMGEPVTFNITPGASDASYTLTYSFAGETGTIVTQTTDTSITWTPPLELAAELPSSTEGTATITMTVYNSSGSVIRTELLYLTLNVPETLLPVVPDNGIVIDLVKSIGGYALTGETYANITPTVDVNGTYGSTVKSITATVANGENVQTISWSSVSEVDAGIFVGDPLPTNIFTTEGTVITSIEVVDSRNRVVTAQGPDVTVLAYTRPVISYFAIDRYEPVYDENEEVSGYAISDVGENVWVNIQANATDLSPDGTQLNSIYWSIVTTEGGVVTTDDSYSGVGEGVVVNVVDDRGIITDVVSASETKNYTLTVIDAVGNVAYAYDAVVPGRANFSLAPSKYGAAFGGIAKGTEENPMLESYYPNHLYDLTYLSGGLGGVKLGNGMNHGKKTFSVTHGTATYYSNFFTVALTEPGLYFINIYVQYSGKNAGVRRWFARFNGANAAGNFCSATTSGGSCSLGGSVIGVTSGTTLELDSHQGSGVNLTVSGFVEWIRIPIIE